MPSCVASLGSNTYCLHLREFRPVIQSPLKVCCLRGVFTDLSPAYHFSTLATTYCCPLIHIELFPQLNEILRSGPTFWYPHSLVKSSALTALGVTHIFHLLCNIGLGKSVLYVADLSWNTDFSSTVKRSLLKFILPIELGEFIWVSILFSWFNKDLLHNKYRLKFSSLYPSLGAIHLSLPNPCLPSLPSVVSLGQTGQSVSLDVHLHNLLMCFCLRMHFSSIWLLPVF